MILDSISDTTLNKIIKWLVVAIVVAAVAGAALLIYRAWPSSEVSPAVREAIEKAQAEIKKDPNNADARVKLASIYFAEGEYGDAKQQLETALRINKNHMAALQVMGAIYETEDDNAKAVTYYKKAIALGEKTEFKSLNPYLYEAVYRLGAIYVDQKKDKEAIEVLKKGISYNPVDSDMRNLLGLAYLNNKQYDEAIKEFQIALKYVPEFAEAYYGLGQAYEEKGDKAQAKDAYEKAVQYGDNYTEAEKALERVK
jgi:tetratricopeptide (TPR) repeat protein